MEFFTRENVDLAGTVIQIVVVLGGIVWAYYRFRAEAPHRPRIEFDIDADFFGPQDDHFATQIVVNAHNKGLRVRKFKSIDLLVRGISKEAPLDEWQGHEPRLFLPDKIIDHAEMVFTDKYGSVFVEPGVQQDLTYFCRIPARYRFVSIRAEFRYDDTRTHSAERLFETPVLE
ncbi:MAG: hypothetical protein AAF423_07750 [Pseudomonadota bacterium]